LFSKPSGFAFTSAHLANGTEFQSESSLGFCYGRPAALLKNAMVPAWRLKDPQQNPRLDSSCSVVTQKIQDQLALVAEKWLDVVQTTRKKLEIPGNSMLEESNHFSAINVHPVDLYMGNK
jgi:hypothetical protein